MLARQCVNSVDVGDRVGPLLCSVFLATTGDRGCRGISCACQRACEAEAEKEGCVSACVS